MVGYLSGLHALADARMRTAALPPDAGILFVEGRDDVRLFLPHTFGLQYLVPCGNKHKLMQAFQGLDAGEERRFVFLTDCDYDVANGTLTPAPHLIITEHVDIEADLWFAGVVDRLIAELIPGATTSEAALARTTAQLSDRVLGLARRLGLFRQLSASDSLGLNFEGLRYQRLRAVGAERVDDRVIATVLTQRSQGAVCSVEDLLSAVDAGDPANNVCHSDDLVGALITVARRDFGITLPSPSEVGRLIRMATVPEVLDQLALTRRIRDWEIQAGRKILR